MTEIGEFITQLHAEGVLAMDSCAPLLKRDALKVADRGRLAGLSDIQIGVVLGFVWYGNCHDETHTHEPAGEWWDPSDPSDVTLVST